MPAAGQNQQHFLLHKMFCLKLSGEKVSLGDSGTPVKKNHFPWALL